MSAEDYYDETLTCSACLCPLHNEAERQEHYASDWHIYNVKRKTADLPPIPFSLFNEKFSLVKKMKDAEKQRHSQITCPITNRQFKSQAAYDHFLGTKEYARQYERYMQRQERAATEAPTSEAAPAYNKFIITYVTPGPEIDSPNEDDLALIKQDQEDAIKAAEQEQQKQQEGETAEGAAAAEDDDVAQDQDDADEDDEEPLEGQIAIPLKYSLFDNQGPFTCVRTCLQYMLAKYGFKLPYVDYLVDCEGLLEYIGAKIGFAHLCPQCNKHFQTTKGLQQHMISQNHISFTLDQLQQDDSQTSDESIVFQYYDFAHNLADGTFTTEEQEERQMMRLRTLLVLGKRTLQDIYREEANGINVLSTVLTVPTQHDVQLQSITDDGNIKLNDGSIILALKNRRDYIQSKTVAYYEKQNQQIAEYKLQRLSEYTLDKQVEVKELKHWQRYLRHKALRTGLNNNYIIKEYFRRQNQ